MPQTDCLDCLDCLEITRSQRECINCGGPVREAIVRLPGAPGGEGNAGEGPHHGWSCDRCHALWDGGRRYGYACPEHGGHEPYGKPARATIEPGTPMGEYEGCNAGGDSE